jgi:hypothetical protein
VGVECPRSLCPYYFDCVKEADWVAMGFHAWAKSSLNVPSFFTGGVESLMLLWINVTLFPRKGKYQIPSSSVILILGLSNTCIRFVWVQICA